MEFILHLDRRRTMSRSAGVRIQELLLLNRLHRLSAAWFQPDLLAEHYPDKSLPLLGDCELPDFFEFSKNDQVRIRSLMPPAHNGNESAHVSAEELKCVVDTLESAQIPDHAGRVKIISQILQQKHATLNSANPRGRGGEMKTESRPAESQPVESRPVEIWSAEIRRYVKTLLWSLKKLGFRKYADEFRMLETQLREGIRSGILPDFSRELDEVVQRVRPRMG